MIKKILFGLLILISFSANSQVHTQVIGDSIYMHSNTGTAELILENSTKNVNGFLYNKGNGRTEFRKGLIKINDSLYIIGGDTLNRGTGVVPISNLTPAIGNNIIDNSNYNQEWRWNSLSGGSGLKLFSNSTAATGNTQKLFDVQSAGANATSGQSTYAGYFKNTHTGTSSTNYGLYTEASGGTNNYSIYSNSGINYFSGKTSIGTTTFASDEKVNVAGTARFSMTYNSATPVPAYLSGVPYGGSGSITVNSGTHGSNYIYGLNGVASINPGAGNNFTTINTAGVAGNLILQEGTITSGSGVPKFSGVYATINSGNPTIIDHASLMSTSGGLTTGTTINNLYHLYLGSITGSGGTAGVTNYWGIYQAGGVKNYFGGRVLIGSTTDLGTAYPLQVTGQSYFSQKINQVTSGLQSIAIGNVFTNNGDAQNTVYLGHAAGRFLSNTSHFNIGIGTGALGTGSTRTITENLAIGYLALQNATTNGNVALGYYAAPMLTSGTGIFIGRNTGADLSTGNNNLVIGRNSLTKHTTDSNNWGSINHSDVIILGHNVMNPQVVYSGSDAPISNTTIIGNSINTSLSNVVLLGTSTQKAILPNTSFGFSTQTVPTARIHVAAGTASAGTAPVKLTAGTNLTTPENGAVEYDGTNYYVTSASTRYTLAKTLTATATLNFTNTAAQNSSDLTVTLTGAADGDAVSVGVPNAAINNNSSYSAWVSAANTVTIRFNNFSSAAIDPASGTFRVSVIKY